ncbi:MAG: LEPR-XLL domain-containing protein [Oscillospiraceae bacterium]|nr:LEPR-XLL domain-containing protein [Oscillospiraceae bacterium]
MEVKIQRLLLSADPLTQLNP